jgi:hypothetical protein
MPHTILVRIVAVAQQLLQEAYADGLWAILRARPRPAIHVLVYLHRLAECGLLEGRGDRVRGDLLLRQSGEEDLRGHAVDPVHFVDHPFDDAPNREEAGGLRRRAMPGRPHAEAAKPCSVPEDPPLFEAAYHHWFPCSSWPVSQWSFSFVALGLVVLLLPRRVALEGRGAEDGVGLERLAPADAGRG